MSDRMNVCIIGGGATGAALLWALSQDPNRKYNITLIHNAAQLGGHSNTPAVKWNGKTFNVDIGVQFISPMLYPNVHDMLKKPEFKSTVPVFDYDSLKIACAFPRDANNNPMNWGNFPEYQPGANNPQSNNFTLFDADMMEDCRTFQGFLEISILEWAGLSLQDFFDNPPPWVVFKNKQRFLDYFLKPYLSIMNGYGAALMKTTLLGELFPLFASIPFEKTPMGSFTQPGTGWQRFTNGAQSWVQAMADVANKLSPTNNILLGYTATQVYTNPTTGAVNVQCTDENNAPHSYVFDKVVLTTDMWTNSKLLNNPNNAYYWNNLYEKYVGYPETPNGPPPVWPLMWGKCYIHTDESMLSPDLRTQDETLQFTASYAPGTTDGNYDLSKTFTTYMQKNLLNDPAAEGLYLTMYGYVPDPKTDTIPAQSTWLTDPITWTHGKWTPAFMGGPKGKLHLAQGLGSLSYSYPGQMDTNVYFAGNNATADSEEGALDAAMIIADYAFNVLYPLPSLNPMAWFMYEMYHNVMFPKPGVSESIARMYKAAPRQPMAMAKTAKVSKAKPSKQKSNKVKLSKIIKPTKNKAGTRAQPKSVKSKPTQGKTKPVTKTKKGKVVKASKTKSVKATKVKPVTQAKVKATNIAKAKSVADRKKVKAAKAKTLSRKPVVKKKKW